nr:hypothetical protein [Tanacetum cinerariifolium]
MRSKRNIKPTKIFDNSVTSTSRNSNKQKNASKTSGNENVNVDERVDCTNESEGVCNNLEKVNGVMLGEPMNCENDLMNIDREEDVSERKNEVIVEDGCNNGSKDENDDQTCVKGKVDEEMISLQQNNLVDAGEKSVMGLEKEFCEVSKENAKYNVSDSTNNPVWNNENTRKPYSTNSYAAITSKNNNDTNRKLDFGPTPVEDANKFVIFDEELVKSGSEKWNLTICGHFIGMRMPYLELKYNLVRMWGKHGLGEMFCNDNEVYCFKFKHEEGMNFVLENSPWMVNGRPLIVQNWSPEVCLYKPEPYKVPLWVKMFDIPFEAWSHKGISKLASSIGKPLIMDEMIANMCQFGRGRIGFARVLIEVDAKKPFKDRIDVQYRDKSGNIIRTKHIRIEYSWKPTVCDFCSVFGLSTKMFSKRPKTEEEKEKQKQDMARIEGYKDGYVDNRRKQFQQNNAHKRIPQNNNVKGRNKENKEGNKWYNGNNVKYAYRLKQTDILEKEKKNSGKANENKEPQMIKNMKTNNGSNGKLCSNKYAALADHNDEGSGRNINVEQKNEVNYFVQQKLQPTPFEISKWSLEMKLKEWQKEMISFINNLMIELNTINNLNMELKLSSWNIRGMGTVDKQDEIQRLILENNLSIIAILETGVKGKEIDRICSKVFNRWNWMENVQEKIKFLCSFVYAANNGKDRVELWKDLALQKQIVNGRPWVLIGDFNVTLHAHEHSAGSSPMDKDDLMFIKKLDVMEASNKIKDFTDKEIQEAMFDIDNDKALRPDRYTSCFFNKAWNVVGMDVFLAMKEFFQIGKLLKKMNATIISLIPKLDTPNKVSDFRPIACCNDLYKCISKVLTNRIKSRLEKVVSINQSAFIPGRNIQDNILLTQELLKGYNRKNGPKRCTLKIDLQKAYDTVSWSFLKTILERFGFHDVMINWIMTCISTSAFSINVNGQSHGFFKDDLMVFCNGDVHSITVVKKSLNEFSRVSGLFPNLKKNTIFFGSVNGEVKQEILKIMDFSIGKLPMRYLGRLQLISSVLASMQTYWASVYLIPKTVVKETDKVMKNFLWSHRGSNGGKAKIA